MQAQDICWLSASELLRLIRRKELSTTEVTLAHLAQIEHLNPKVNAIVTLAAEQALEQARAADEVQAQGHELGLLHGLPIAHKDLQDTKGIRTTYGSPIYQNHVPEQDSLLVERLKAAGAITLGKTNTPEFGAGSQTFNTVFGATRNPFDIEKTCGGSSGGAAVALACGMLPLADGSDMGGSLRNPASFCNVVGFRPSPGRVPSWPKKLAHFTLSTDGPMARTVSDVALMLSVMAGADDRSPISQTEPSTMFQASLESSFAGCRVAWLTDLPDMPVEAEVRSIVNAQRDIFQAIGCDITEDVPDFQGADEAFKTLRAWSFAHAHKQHLLEHRDKLKDTVIWNTEEGLRLSGQQVARAFEQQTEVYHNMREFMTGVDFLVLPTVQVLPFAVSQPYVSEINGVALETYIDWMKSCYLISVTGLPAISVPAGFSASGLPVGLQIVGRHRADLSVLQLAYAFEQRTQIGAQRPAL